MSTLRAACAALVLVGLAVPAAFAQTTAGTGTSIVVPITAQTASFASEVTVFNPNGAPITVDVAFYEANNSTTPGLKTCTDVVVPANRSVQFALSPQCTLTAASHFGLLVLTDLAGTNSFYGYARVQNPQGIGFSIEGFPAGNFNDQVSHTTGLKKTTTGLIFQTNCFVGSLASPVSYTLKLFNDATGAQIGGTLSGSLAAFQQFRYLDVFGINGVNAPNVDQLNVRAEFTPTTTAKLIGFCTVQDNTSFGADFRIAKSFGAPGTVTTVTAGVGLTGGVITTTGTLAVDTSIVQSRVTGTCGVGSSIRAIAENGTVTCEVDDVGTGTVTNVATGTGLTGGPITTTGTLSVDTSAIQARVTGSCAVGNYIRAIAANGTVTCQAESGPPAAALLRPAWSDTAVTASIGQDASISMMIGSDGMPLLGVYDATAKDLKVIHCSNIACTSSTTATIDSTGDVGRYNSIAIGSNGLGVISYYDATTTSLKLARCTDLACSSATLSFVDQTNDVGQYSSLVINGSGRPVISYYDNTAHDLKIAYCNDVACSSPTVATPDTTGDVGSHTAALINRNQLYVSYVDVTNGKLKLVLCGTFSCGGPIFRTLDAGPQAFLYTSIAFGAAGEPIVFYVQANDPADPTAGGSDRFARCTPAVTGSSVSCVTSATTTITSHGNFFPHGTSLAVAPDGLPFLGREDTPQRCATVDCVAQVAIGGSGTSVIWPAGVVNPKSAAAIGIDGFPIYAYHANTATVHVVHCSSRDCTQNARDR